MLSRRLRLFALELAIRVRAISHSHYFHLPFLIGAACLCVFWYRHPPIPNKSVLAIGVVAVIMTLTEMRPSHKAAWLVIVFTLAVLESRAIDKERTDTNKERAATRIEETTQFQGIGDGIKAAITQSQQQFQQTVQQQSSNFSATMIRAQMNTDEITGGDSYVIVYPDTTRTGNDSLPLRARACFKCQYAVPDANVYLQPNLASTDNGQLIFRETITPVPHIRGVLTPPSRIGETVYRIRVMARNKPTEEILRLRFDPQSQGWEYRYRLERTETNPHYNPKTKMAEGMVLKLLEDSGWMTNALTPSNPKTTKAIH